MNILGAPLETVERECQERSSQAAMHAYKTYSSTPAQAYWLCWYWTVTECVMSHREDRVGHWQLDYIHSLIQFYLGLTKSNVKEQGSEYVLINQRAMTICTDFLTQQRSPLNYSCYSNSRTDTFPLHLTQHLWARLTLGKQWMYTARKKIGR